ncbi:MAG: hypothetical protein ABIZ04_23145 [Opitutus sp.]
MNFVEKLKLPRLARGYYHGFAAIFWTHTIDGRETGWLSDVFHQQFRELLVHCCARYQLICPSYVLMPDHCHVVLLGLSNGSDQLLATRFLRHSLKRLVAPAKLQDRPYDHVLREDERGRGALASACDYVWQNPVRGKLVSDWRAWRFTGAVVVGYPSFDPRSQLFWADFWKVYGRLISKSEGVPLLPQRAT